MIGDNTTIAATAVGDSCVESMSIDDHEQSDDDTYDDDGHHGSTSMVSIHSPRRFSTNSRADGYGTGRRPCVHGGVIYARDSVDRRDQSHRRAAISDPISDHQARERFYRQALTVNIGVADVSRNDFLVRIHINSHVDDDMAKTMQSVSARVALNSFSRLCDNPACDEPFRYVLRFRCRFIHSSWPTFYCHTHMMFHLLAHQQCGCFRLWDIRHRRWQQTIENFFFF